MRNHVVQKAGRGGNPRSCGRVLLSLGQQIVEAGRPIAFQRSRIGRTAVNPIITPAGVLEAGIYSIKASKRADHIGDSCKTALLHADMLARVRPRVLRLLRLALLSSLLHMDMLARVWPRVLMLLRLALLSRRPQPWICGLQWHSRRLNVPLENYS